MYNTTLDNISVIAWWSDFVYGRNYQMNLRNYNESGFAIKSFKLLNHLTKTTYLFVFYILSSEILCHIFKIYFKLF